MHAHNKIIKCKPYNRNKQVEYGTPQETITKAPIIAGNKNINLLVMAQKQQKHKDSLNDTVTVLTG